jgi:hypothetical protein
VLKATQRKLLRSDLAAIVTRSETAKDDSRELSDLIADVKDGPFADADLARETAFGIQNALNEAATAIAGIITKLTDAGMFEDANVQDGD